jgi:hypothetical protein
VPVVPLGVKERTATTLLPSAGVIGKLAPDVAVILDQQGLVLVCSLRMKLSVSALSVPVVGLFAMNLIAWQISL